MKSIIRGIVLSIFVVLSSNASAAYAAKQKWQLGFDIGWQETDPEGEFNKVFKQDFLALNTYIGYKLSNKVAVHCGYSWTARNAEEAFVSSGDTLFGVAATADSVYSAKISHKNTHFSLYYHYNLTSWLEGFGFGGVGFARQGITLSHGPLASNTSNNLIREFFMIEGKTKFVWRFGLGAQTMLAKNYGIRGLFTYQTLSQVRLRGKPTNASAKAFKDSFYLGLGFFYRLH